METAEELKEVIDQINRTIEIVSKRKEKTESDYSRGYEAGVAHVCSLLQLDITVVQTKINLFYSGVTQN